MTAVQTYQWSAPLTGGHDSARHYLLVGLAKMSRNTCLRVHVLQFSYVWGYVFELFVSVACCCLLLLTVPYFFEPGLFSASCSAFRFFLACASRQWHFFLLPACCFLSFSFCAYFLLTAFWFHFLLIALRYLFMFLAVASCWSLSTCCFLLPACWFLLVAFCFLLSVSCILCYVDSQRLETRKQNQ